MVIGVECVTATALEVGYTIRFYVHLGPDADTPIAARLELGVIARLGACEPDWCRLTAGGYRGWARKAQLGGVKPKEIRD